MTTCIDKNNKIILSDINIILNNYYNLIEDDFTYLINLLISNNIHESWYQLFLNNYKKLIPILKEIDKLRITEIIYPEKIFIFRIFQKNIQDIKIVLLGQDPYINKDQAMGYSFSVPQHINIPPSLLNIFKEINNEFPERNYKFIHGDLTKWYDQGIFLLNSSLTVLHGKSNSHQYLWSWFTDNVILYINNYRSNVIFLLLGRNAIDKHKYISKDKNIIITGVHPSPLSAYNGFFSSNIFIKIEEKLEKEFDWSN